MSCLYHKLNRSERNEKTAYERGSTFTKSTLAQKMHYQIQPTHSSHQKHTHAVFRQHTTRLRSSRKNPTSGAHVICTDLSSTRLYSTSQLPGAPSRDRGTLPQVQTSYTYIHYQEAKQYSFRCAKRRLPCTDSGELCLIRGGFILHPRG